MSYGVFELGFMLGCNYSSESIKPKCKLLTVNYEIFLYFKLNFLSCFRKGGSLFIKKSFILSTKKSYDSLKESVQNVQT